MKIQTLLASLLLSTTALAQTPSVKPIILKSPYDFQILAASANGKWACGAYVDNSNETYGFRWNLESNEVELLNPAYPSAAFSISNDGLVVGYFTDNTFLANGASVTMAGYWKDGKWNRFEIPENTATYANALSVSPDGHYACGYVSPDNSKYVAYVWKDGKVDRELVGTDISQAYAVSPDGKYATGWIFRKNRTGILWGPGEEYSILSDYQSPWSSGRKFSPDGTKLLYWGGYVNTGTTTNPQYGLSSIYDMATKQSTVLYALDENSNFDFYDISDKGTVVGENGKGFIYQNGEMSYADDYLVEHGVDLDAEHIGKVEDADYYMISRVSTISADDNVMSLQYYNDDKDENGALAGALQSMVLKFNQATTGLCPVSVKAEQASGVNNVALSWKPNVAAKGITGYNVYCDGAKANNEIITDECFALNDLTVGSHKFAVTAMYGDTESEKSQEVDVDVVAHSLSAPGSLFAQQQGYNSAYLEWTEPATNFSLLAYYNNATADVLPFGLGSKGDSFETAICLSKAKVSAYAGMKISEVGFYPMSEQANWKLNVYTHNAEGKLQLLYTQPITQTLDYGKRNVVKLDKPMDIVADMIIAIEVSVTNTNVSGIVGYVNGMATYGIDDLTRMTGTNGDDEFTSFGQMNFDNGYLAPYSWAIDAVAAPAGADLSKDGVVRYDVYLDDKGVSSTKDNHIVVPFVANGSHTFAVKAVYAGDQKSEMTTATLNIAANEAMLKKVDVVSIEHTTNSKVKALWPAPRDYDNVKLQYSKEEASKTAVRGSKSANWALMAATNYSSNMFKGREGYQISSVRFYPLTDAEFTIYLYENNNLVAEQEVDGYNLNTWNEVKLDKPVTIHKNCEYMLAVDCYDVTPEMAPLAVDDAMSVAGYSDLYSTDGGDSWNPLSSNSVYANWLMSLNIENPNPSYLPVDGYDIYIDGEKKNTEKLTKTNFDYDFGAEDAKQHTVQVDAYFTGTTEAVKGTTNTFFIGTAGINDNTMATVEIQKGDNEISVVGNGVTSVELVSAAGATVASAKGNTVSLNGVSAGVYVVKAVVNGETVTRKVEVK